MKQKVCIDDLTELCTASYPVWSEDGKSLYYFETRASFESNSYCSGLKVAVPRKGISPLRINPICKNIIPLLNGKILYTVAPTGKDLNFVKAGGYLSIFEEAFPDGGGRQEAFRLPFRDAVLKKIDEKRFLVFAFCELLRPDIENLQDEKQEIALKAWQEENEYIVCDELPFCSDGRGYISGKRRRMFLFDRDTNMLRDFLDIHFEVGVGAVYGDMLVFTGTPHNGIRDLSQGLYLYHFSNGEMTTLAAPGKYHVKDVAFVDGQIIAAVNSWKGFESRYGHSLYRFGFSGEEPVLCADLSDEDIGFGVASDCTFGSGTTFASFGEKLFFISTKNNTCVLKSWDLNEGVCCLTPENFVAEFFAVKDDQIAIYGSKLGELQEIYLLQDGILEPITNMNSQYMHTHNVSRPIAVQIKNRENTLIDGWIILPVDYDPKHFYPALLEIHGGPRLIYSFGFFHEMQVMASKGYFVFFCNPRGSSGRGNEFADIRGIRGTIDYQDIMDFTDGILALYPQIDTCRLAVAGGSYGGFMVNWIIGHTDRFAAAVSCRSNSNIIGNYGVSDNGIWSLEGSYGGNIWANHDLIWNQSPLKYAEKAVTPTLFLHSLEDYSCRFPNSMQMYVALRTHGTNARMVLFKNESHSLSRTGKPKNRKRRLKEFCSWIDTHILF